MPTSPLPLRHGLGAAWIRTEPGASVESMSAYLRSRLPMVAPEAVIAKLEHGEFVYQDGSVVGANDAYEPHRFVFFHRELRDEPMVPGDLHVLHRDERIVVIDKPHFLATIPRGRHVTQSVVVRAREQFGLPELSPVHRLDRVTAGVLVLTTERRWRGPYQSMFEHRTPRKEYEAIAEAPAVREDRWEVRSHLVKERGTWQVTDRDDLAPNAHTTIEVMERRDGLGWYRAVPHTGKTHQIRAHMLRIGRPIVNDPLYPVVREVSVDDFSQPLQLLARTLRFVDPVDGEEREYCSERQLDRWPL